MQMYLILNILMTKIRSKIRK